MSNPNRKRNFPRIYIYKRLRPRNKNPQQKKERATETFINEIEHQTS